MDLSRSNRSVACGPCFSSFPVEHYYPFMAFGKAEGAYIYLPAVVLIVKNTHQQFTNSVQ